MRPASGVKGLFDSLIGHQEAEWLEFKVNNCEPQEIGDNISAISNSARLHQHEAGYIVWGVENGTRKVLGTNFSPRERKIGNQELENWLATQLEPRINFDIYELDVNGNHVVIFEVQPCQDRPTSFRGAEFIRVGTYTKPLRDHPEKERALWIRGSQQPFERDIAMHDVSSNDVVNLLRWPTFFTLLQEPQSNRAGAVLDRLEAEKFVVRSGDDKWNITNLGAILFAGNLREFGTLERKAVRVVLYAGEDRTQTVREQSGLFGYAAGFEGLVEYINNQLPTNEQIGQALRHQVRMYPELAIRELVANALIHQDFRIQGTGPMIEIFSDRLEITNPGRPLISTLRFIDEPPQSRNEAFAALMRRFRICEERGSGIDKVIFEVEYYQLPPPDFDAKEHHTRVTLFAPRRLSEMNKAERIRACYQHASLLRVSNKQMTNASLRTRFKIEEKNYSIASRIIRETIDADLIRPSDPENTSKRHATYIPFWA